MKSAIFREEKILNPPGVEVVNFVKGVINVGQSKHKNDSNRNRFELLQNNTISFSIYIFV